MPPRVDLLTTAAIAAALPLASCHSSPTPSPPYAASIAAAETTAAETTGSASPVAAGASATAESPATNAASKPSEAGRPVPCGAARCRAFASPEAALEALLAETKPAILAVGEAHAQRDAEGPSTVARFTGELLPALRGRASALVVEVMVADARCGKATDAKVAEQQRPVTEGQATSNPNDYAKLAESARALGIVPFPLRPACEDLERVKAAGDDGVLVLLEVVTKTMGARLAALWSDTQTKSPGRFVVGYGGAMHNDRVPLEGREDWSFAAPLDAATSGRFVELDLIDRRSVRNTDAWTRLRWRPAYDALAPTADDVLIELGPRSFALVFAGR
jgi:hypothetical protein